MMSITPIIPLETSVANLYDNMANKPDVRCLSRSFASEEASNKESSGEQDPKGHSHEQAVDVRNTDPTADTIHCFRVSWVTREYPQITQERRTGEREGRGINEPQEGGQVK